MEGNISIKGYEIKFFLDITKALNEKNEIKKDIIDIFQISNLKQKDIQFIDAVNNDMYNDGWILRNRKKEGDDKYELTYKKRYEIIDSNTDSVLEQAKGEGVIQNNEEYELEWEWGYTKQKLSVSFEEKPEATTSATGMPSIDELKKLFLHNSPKAFINWKNKDYGVEKINRSRACGPIHAKVYEGKWDESNITIEIWSKIINNRTESIIEVSKKVKDESIATCYHTKLKNYLQEKDWLLMQDFSKTEWALTNCN
ncbi:hypothetical protein CN993_25020 [Bacillus thuringiensis]|uniref:hypothetical protein n=1 Tax=Bacillus thuringiensis TaxID=1428 RepID=UPI000BFBC2E8|nr:hypothetical protein [Bacillus thuringiensis]PGP40639.1 hypothetical protein CN993_25020 [Bacillus thuringiensis]